MAEKNLNLQNLDLSLLETLSPAEQELALSILKESPINSICLSSIFINELFGKAIKDFNLLTIFTSSTKSLLVISK